MPGNWFPLHFSATHAHPQRPEVTYWTRETLFPLLAVPLGFEYCMTIGSLELNEYAAFFTPRAMPVPAGMARVLGVSAGQPVIYFPRRSFDLWGVRYFLLPASPDWTSQDRGIASFLDQTELIYPSPDVLYEKKDRQGREPWSIRHDWQLRRNKAAYPRAWVVHLAQVRSPTSDPETPAPQRIRTLIYMNDSIWSEQPHDRPIFNPRQAAWIETDDKEALKRFISRNARWALRVGGGGQARAAAGGALGLAGEAGLRHPGRYLLSRLGLDDRRQDRADLPDQPHDARGRRAGG